MTRRRAVLTPKVYPAILLPFVPPRWAGSWCNREVRRQERSRYGQLGWGPCGGAVLRDEDGWLRCENCRHTFGRWRRSEG